MKTKLAALLFTGLLGTALAQEPTVITSPAPAPSAPAAASPAPDRMVYAPRLPVAAELANIAAAQGQTVERIEQTASEISITTKAADGRITTVAYYLLASAGNTPAAVGPDGQPATQTTVVVHSQPQVVYHDPYYYGGYPYYYGYPYWYPYPVSIGIGFGWGYYGHGYYGHGYYGGYHGHGGYYGGGGHHH